MAPVPAPGRPRVATFAATLTAALVVAMAGTALAAEDLDCSDFDHQEEAQAVLDEDRSDPHRLDGGPDAPRDGVACESLPHRGAADDAADEDEAAPVTTPATPYEDGEGAGAGNENAENGDPDCAGFPTRTAAQSAPTRGPGDHDRLDAAGDGIACEQQVAVFPQGGVVTGGVPHP